MLMPTNVESPETQPAPSTASGLSGPVGLDAALDRASQHLRQRQFKSGHWVGELQGDSILESEYLLLMFILGLEADPALPKINNYLRRLQNEDGGWSLFPGGPADISGTVKAYFALKLMGDDPNAPHMIKARELILSLGGAEKCNTFTKFYFAALGQISFDACPSIPPEVVFLPQWFYFNLYNVSAWTRTMILPLGIVTSLRPVRKLPPERGISELYLDKKAANRLSDPVGWPRDWREIFLKIDQVLKFYNQSPLGFLREKALKSAEKWMLEHLEGCDGLGAIFPPMVYILIVFRLLGYRDDHPVVAKAHKDLRDLFLDGPGKDEIRIQPCHSPVWDTGLALHALAEGGIRPDDPAATNATRWLLEKECQIASDWKLNCPAGPDFGGWFFEFNNPHYPDVDDTAAVTMALKRAGGPAAQAAVERGMKFLLAMQNADGGWAAFDHTKDRPLLEKVPFADHNAMQDPSCPDIAGRVLECLGHNGMKADHPQIAASIRYIRGQQDVDGPWWGRWGVNFIYGSWQVLTGLNSVKTDMSQPWIQRAADWLKKVQKPDGSFGETAQSYDDQTLKGKGPSTASQTAWGAMGMMAACGPNDPAVVRALQWLIDNQAADGNWEEHWFTGTGFPKVFYLKYHLYRLYFPLTALARHKRMKGLVA